VANEVAITIIIEYYTCWRKLSL